MSVKNSLINKQRLENQAPIPDDAPLSKINRNNICTVLWEIGSRSFESINTLHEQEVTLGNHRLKLEKSFTALLSIDECNDANWFLREVKDKPYFFCQIASEDSSLCLKFSKKRAPGDEKLANEMSEIFREKTTFLKHLAKEMSKAFIHRYTHGGSKFDLCFMMDSWEESKWIDMYDADKQIDLTFLEMQKKSYSTENASIFREVLEGLIEWKLYKNDCRGWNRYFEKYGLRGFCCQVAQNSSNEPLYLKLKLATEPSQHMKKIIADVRTKLEDRDAMLKMMPEIITDELIGYYEEGKFKEMHDSMVRLNKKNEGAWYVRFGKNFSTPSTNEIEQLLWKMEQFSYTVDGKLQKDRVVKFRGELTSLIIRTRFQEGLKDIRKHLNIEHVSCELKDDPGEDDLSLNLIVSKNADSTTIEYAKLMNEWVSKLNLFFMESGNKICTALIFEYMKGRSYEHLCTFKDTLELSYIERYDDLRRKITSLNHYLVFLQQKLNSHFTIMIRTQQNERQNLISFHQSVLQSLFLKIYLSMHCIMKNQTLEKQGLSHFLSYRVVERKSGWQIEVNILNKNSLPKRVPIEKIRNNLDIVNIFLTKVVDRRVTDSIKVFDEGGNTQEFLKKSRILDRIERIEWKRFLKDHNPSLMKEKIVNKNGKGL
ncbi:MAG: hypothetical protein K1060chlam2_01120 [Chlamydiae bacterium]|nr:hypothetical protein [Chlamydiota bacterium]